MNTITTTMNVNGAATVPSLSHATLTLILVLLFHENKTRRRRLSLSVSVLLLFLLLPAANSDVVPSHFSKFPHQNAAFLPSVHTILTQALAARAIALNLPADSAAAATSPLVDCLELLDDTFQQLSNVANGDPGTTRHDVLTWLSAALTNQETCVDSLSRFDDPGLIMESTSRNLSRSITESLAGYARKTTTRRGLMIMKRDRFPSWVSARERRILEAPVEELVVQAVVAKDGGGTHGTIREAVMEAAAGGGGNNGRTVIYVKAGSYKEYLKFPTKQKNVMLVGDGKGKTVIIGDRNYEDGWTTFQSATVAAMGDGFMARDITFVNSAGPAKHQAVALLVGADKAVIYRCSVQGFQDTLYAHSKRQFYRETDVYGTVDFIFGNAAAVFQNCGIFPRKPNNADNFITAQGRTSPYQNTGFSIHNCRISAAGDLAPAKSKVRTFLGRPWKEYSTTVIMQSFIDDSIQSSGWSPWAGGFGLKTLYYGEYLNSGPGAAVSGRVKWPGYHAAMTPTEAEGFTVAGLIAGHTWLPATGISFDAGLIR